MCRHAAYLGPPIPLARFLLEPAHGLLQQATAPRELLYAGLNGDGFGFGWYAPDDGTAVYRNPAPIWTDPNLEALGRSLEADLWIATVRSATPGFPPGLINTQPFHDGDHLFTHNGFIRDFTRSLRPALLRILHPDIEAAVRGNTDSEYLFALLRQMLWEDGGRAPEVAIAETLGLVEEWADDAPALLNLLFSDGERIYATRHAINHACPSLYYTTDDEAFPDGAQLVASECLTEDGLWHTVPEHHILILDAEAPPELIAL
ncbi:MAG: ergothioneine biosynthesis protein EgtC [Ectothiorhodospiraceae bacterium]|jgi:glutamine amidotransferase|nr:ergothioneine biosynthesis protein EgtC [Ectothiorhodospiraceae bacterium]